MNILGIGPAEMGIIAVAALLIFGPGKLPEVMGQAGKMVRDFRRMSAELTGEFEKTIAEAKDVGATFSKEVGGMSDQVTSVTNSVKKDLGVKGSTSSAAKPKSGAGARSTGSGTSSRTGKGSTGSAAKASSSTTSRKSGSTPGDKKVTTTTSSAAKASTAPKKPVTPVASREDPGADISLFEPATVERPRRARRATPSVITDPTPRGESTSDPGSPDRTAAASPPVDDALARARARRRGAQYGQRSTPQPPAVG